MTRTQALGRHACALVLGLGLLAASAPGALAFSIGSALLPKLKPASTRGQAIQGSRRAAAALGGLSMIYMPPRPEGPMTELTLDELKEALDRSVNLPSPKSRESPKVAVQRSPCTSLYGTYRPTTSSGAWKSSGATRMIKGRPRTMLSPPVTESIGNEPKRPRGRPSKLSKSAVNEMLLTEFLVRAAKVLLLNGGRMDSNLFGQHWKTMHRSAPLASFKSHKGVAVHQMFRENIDFFEVRDTDRQKVKMFEIKKDALAKYLDNVGAVVTLDSLEAEEELVKLRTGVPTTEQEAAPAAALEPEAEAEDEVAVEEDQVDVAPQALQVPEVHYDVVPVQGKARNSLGIDRRQAKAQRLSKAKAASDDEEEVAPAAPERHPDDACTRKVVSLYNGWAADGRDVVMEVSNEPPLSETLQTVVGELAEARPSLRAVDVGCGNGWAARLTKTLAPEASVTAVDAASRMVQRATELDTEGACAYEIGDVAGDWEPEAGVDLVLAVELLHLVEDPAAVLVKMARWLQPGGRAIVTLECYKENRLSQSWAADLGVPMTVLEEKQWVAMMEAAGLVDVEAKRSMPTGPWPGMLVMSASKA